MKKYIRSYLYNLKQIIFYLLLLIPSINSYAAMPPQVIVKNNWIRLTPGHAPMAGYFEIINNMTTPLTLRGASSSAFDSIMIHHSKINHGEATMQAVTQALTILPGHHLRFVPGGYHLMLMDHRQPFVAGDQINIQLKFIHHPDIKVNFSFKPIWYQPIK